MGPKQDGVGDSMNFKHKRTDNTYKKKLKIKLECIDSTCLCSGTSQDDELAATEAAEADSLYSARSDRLVVLQVLCVGEVEVSKDVSEELRIRVGLLA